MLPVGNECRTASRIEARFAATLRVGTRCPTSRNTRRTYSPKLKFSAFANRRTYSISPSASRTRSPLSIH